MDGVGCWIQFPLSASLRYQLFYVAGESRVVVFDIATRDVATAGLGDGGVEDFRGGVDALVLCYVKVFQRIFCFLGVLYPVCPFVVGKCVFGSVLIWSVQCN